MPPPLPLVTHAHTVPDKPAVIDDCPGQPPTVWSFAELNRQVNRLTHVLRDLGLRPGDKLVVCGRNSPGIVRAMHARAKLGATLVPLNYRLAAEEAAYVVDNSDATIVYADAEYAGLFAQIRADIPKVRHVVIFDGAAGRDQLYGDRLLAAASDAEPVPEDYSAHPVSMLYTSGT